jgi:hypothetical protein
MKKATILLILCGLLSCKKESPLQSAAVCGVKNAAENLPWLKKRIREEMSGGLLSVYYQEVEGETVLMVQPSLSSCAFCELYSCAGARIRLENRTEEERRRFMEALMKEPKLLWTSTGP